MLHCQCFQTTHHPHRMLLNNGKNNINSLDILHIHRHQTSLTYNFSHDSSSSEQHKQQCRHNSTHSSSSVFFDLPSWLVGVSNLSSMMFVDGASGWGRVDCSSVLCDSFGDTAVAVTTGIVDMASWQSSP
mmetsp:Transcript_9305/g.16503  ORF Transcript_9305/g.16503 Transcript_9305/m.16503 type:complete len:130 (+) Transcript_9305:186-575(+)